MGLLALPVWFFREHHARLAGYDQRTWPTGRHRFLAIADLARSAAGAYLVMKGVLGLAAEWEIRWWVAEGAFGLLLLIGLAIQLATWHDEDHLQAPVFYITGCLLILLHPLVLFPALLLGIGSAMASRAWSGGFLAGAVTIGGLAFLFRQQTWSIGVVGAVLCACPALLAMMSGRHLGWLRKRVEPQDRLR